MPLVEKPGITERIRRLIGVAPGSVSVSPVAGKAFTQGPRSNSVPSVLEDLRQGDHGGRWPSRP